ncbi:2-dehydro-3-deoxyphosphogluconate aldolase/(4S)-4-hydroxy-2-oxoglutarate aldolase [Bartonella doshiae]|uniref:2-dehydro-3-deoxy-phosphogluconate aldolase n=2 Tax=Bartonella doshiae TaxID=33044 RepID=A0A380ZGA4_BARDO|nr:2-dehydro-3-deoxyphosphogluconate aldolase/4-hydroxy-2-oxoglutarate aldolase [Bartonella doshiae NCTC 12862 = ATCC 700133]MBB6159813.1 2-dehydro-3-deoxyphosphogluconate aldolase/(4S)-4-hydroxy-2-oxoglutarate aldolase [Bartonella doshiae]SUV45332.1 KHG/KDPG aldolase [Bartonella doshiae]
MAQALVKGGLRTIEITLRTPKALDAIKAITREVPESIVGAGTILNSLHYKQVERAGAKFIISPGLSNELIDYAKDSEIPLLPGTFHSKKAIHILNFSLLKQLVGSPLFKP